MIKYDASGDSTYITHHLISFELATSVGDQNRWGDQNRFESTYEEKILGMKFSARDKYHTSDFGERSKSVEGHPGT